MRFLLDTSICVYVIKQSPAGVFERFRAHDVGDIGVSSVTVAELSYGVEKSQQTIRNRLALEQFLAPLRVVDFDRSAADSYGEVRATLEAAGTPIGPLDLLIAAHALSLGATLVTNNEREFSRVPDLMVANWVANSLP